MIGRRQANHMTGHPIDEGYCAIVKNYPNLKRLSVIRMINDLVFEYIRHFGNNLESLLIAFGTYGDCALHILLDRCLKP